MEPGRPAPVERDPLLRRWGVAHAFTGRGGGVSRGPFASLNLGFHVGDDPEAVRENRRRAAEAAGVEPASFVLGQQVHSARVAVVGAAQRGSGAGELATALAGVDGLVTREPGVVLAALVADCIPLLLADPQAGVVAAVHAGWRGTLAGIARLAVETMVSLGADPARMVAAMGPSIGACCYRVSEEVARRFAGAYGPSVVRGAAGGPFLDLRRANLQGLLDVGLREPHISWRPPCTACANDRYFSHRAQAGRAGRQAGLVWLPL